MGAIEKASPASPPQAAGRALSPEGAPYLTPRVCLVADPTPGGVYEHTPGWGNGQGGGPVDSTGVANIAEGPSPTLRISRAEERANRLARAVRAFSLEVMRCRGVLMITLTFAGQPDRDTASGAIREFIDRFKKKVGNYKCFWWPELQRRGAIHYHLLVVDCPFLEPERVAELWGRGFVKLRWFDGHRGFSYALKYARKLRKAYQQDYALFSVLYKGFKAYSHSRLRDVVARAFKLPAWLREWVWRFGEIPRRIPGGWEFPTSGRVVTSPWRFDGVDGDCVVLRWVGSVVI